MDSGSGRGIALRAEMARAAGEALADAGRCRIAASSSDS